MQPKKIKAALKSRGYTLSMVAESIGRSPSLVSKVVSDKARSFDAANAVAKAIDKPLDDVFPGKYHTVGQRDYKQSFEYKIKLAELHAQLGSK